MASRADAGCRSTGSAEGPQTRCGPKDESNGVMKLTERKIEQLSVKPGQRDRLIFDDAQRGLAVRVTASGGRTYLTQYTQHGQKYRVPLG